MDPPIDKGWAWMVVLGAAMVHMFIIGGFKSMGILFVEIREEFSASATSTSLMIALLSAAMSILAPIATGVGLRMSNRLVVFMGGLVMFLSAITSYFATSVFYLIISLGLIMGLGYGLAFSPSLCIVGIYFSKRRSLANGIALAGGSIGQLTLPVVFRYAIDAFGLHGALLIYAALVLNVCVGAMLFRPLKFYQSVHKPKTVLETVKNEPDSYIECRCECQYKPSSAGDVRQALNSEDVAKVSSVLSPNQPMKGGVWKNPNSRTPAADKTCHCSCHEQLQSMSLMCTSTGSLCLVDIKTKNKASTEPPTENHGSFLDAIISSFCCCFKFGQKKNVMPLFHWAMFKNFRFTAFVCGICLGNSGYVNSILFLPPFMEFHGFDKKTSAFLLSLIGFLDLFGRIFGGWFSDLQFIKRYNIIAVCLSITAITGLIATRIATLPSLVVFVLVLGFLGGFYISLFPVVLVDFVGIKLLPTGMGLLIMSVGITQGSAPVILGHLRDTYNSFNQVYTLTSCMMLGCSILLAVTPLCQYLQREWLPQHEIIISEEVDKK